MGLCPCSITLNPYIFILTSKHLINLPPLNILNIFWKEVFIFNNFYEIAEAISGFLHSMVPGPVTQFEFGYGY